MFVLPGQPSTSPGGSRCDEKAALGSRARGRSGGEGKGEPRSAWSSAAPGKGWSGLGAVPALGWPEPRECSDIPRPPPGCPEAHQDSPPSSFRLPGCCSPHGYTLLQMERIPYSIAAVTRPLFLESSKAERHIPERWGCSSRC